MAASHRPGFFRFISLGVLSLTGCAEGSRGVASTPAPPPSLLPVNQVVNAVKCELAYTFQNGPGFVSSHEPNGKDIKATLSLENVVTTKNAGGGAFEVVPLGISLGPAGSRESAGTTGQSFAIDFTYDLDDRETIPPFCAELGKDVQIRGHPFVDLLKSLQQQYDLLGEGTPKVKLQSIAYTARFGVETDTKAGVSIKFLIFSFDASRTRSVQRNQALTLKFALALAPRFTTAAPMP